MQRSGPVVAGLAENDKALEAQGGCVRPPTSPGNSRVKVAFGF